MLCLLTRWRGAWYISHKAAMTSKEQSRRLFREYLKARHFLPPIAGLEEDKASAALNSIGGIAGSWRTDYSECTYSQPQMLDGRLHDLSTLEAVRRYHDAKH